MSSIKYLIPCGIKPVIDLQGINLSPFLIFHRTQTISRWVHLDYHSHWPFRKSLYDFDLESIGIGHTQLHSDCKISYYVYQTRWVNRTTIGYESINPGIKLSYTRYHLTINGHVGKNLSLYHYLGSENLIEHVRWGINSYFTWHHTQYVSWSMGLYLYTLSLMNSKNCFDFKTKTVVGLNIGYQRRTHLGELSVRLGGDHLAKWHAQLQFIPNLHWIPATVSPDISYAADRYLGPFIYKAMDNGPAEDIVASAMAQNKRQQRPDAFDISDQHFLQGSTRLVAQFIVD